MSNRARKIPRPRTRKFGISKRPRVIAVSSGKPGAQASSASLRRATTASRRSIRVTKSDTGYAVKINPIVRK